MRVASGFEDDLLAVVLLVLEHLEALLGEPRRSAVCAVVG